MLRVAETIAAISSDTSGRRCIVRASGRDAFAVAGRLAGDPWPGVRGVRAVLVHLPVGSMRTLAITMAGPHSATGEDIVEWLVPGGVGGAMLEAVCAAGARPAEPGEFSMRAFLNGKVSLNEAEGVAASIAAVDADGLQAARHLREGRIGATCDRLQREILSALALVEAGIDFTEEEDVVPIEAPALRSRCEAWEQAIERLSDGAAVTEASSGLPRVVLWGPVNAGKSTLFNALLGRARAVASGESGTTRDALVERLRLRSPAGAVVECELVDVPGLPADGDPFADAARDVMAREVAAAALVLSCARAGDVGRSFGRPLQADRTMPVATCADLGCPLVAGPGAAGPLLVSAHRGDGMEALRHAIVQSLAEWAGAHAGAMSLARHRHALAGTVGSLRDAIVLLRVEGRAIHGTELVAEALRSSVRHLGDVSGHFTSDDVLGEIFASFCVGK